MSYNSNNYWYRYHRNGYQAPADYSNTAGEAIRLLGSGAPMIVFDLETTGRSTANDRILTFSALKVAVRGGKWTELSRIDEGMNPGFHIPEGATAVNGITDEMASKWQSEAELAKKVQAFFGDKPFLCGYNSVSFDEKFIRNMYLRQGLPDLEPKLHLDVLLMARDKLRDLPSRKLGEVTKYFGADKGLSFHQSMDDVIATARVMTKLLPKYE